MSSLNWLASILTCTWSSKIRRGYFRKLKNGNFVNWREKRRINRYPSPYKILSSTSLFRRRRVSLKLLSLSLSNFVESLSLSPFLRGLALRSLSVTFFVGTLWSKICAHRFSISLRSVMSPLCSVFLVSCEFWWFWNRRDWFRWGWSCSWMDNVLWF